MRATNEDERLARSAAIRVRLERRPLERFAELLRRARERSAEDLRPRGRLDRGRARLCDRRGEHAVEARGRSDARQRRGRGVRTTDLFVEKLPKGLHAKDERKNRPNLERFLRRTVHG